MGDVWILQYHNTELDDGSPESKAHLDKFLTGESVMDKDVVIWYGAHFRHVQHHHDASGDGDGPATHVVCPDIRPIKW